MKKNKTNNCFFGSKNKIATIMTLVLMVLPILAQLFVGSSTISRAEGNGTNGTATGNATYGNLVKNPQGEMPKWYWQLGNVRNSHAADGNEPWSDPSDTTHDYLYKENETGNELTSYKIRKFAKETNTKGTYDVFLNVRGNNKNPKPLDIYLVLDNSNSMTKNGSPTNYSLMREGVDGFIKAIMEDENLRTRTRVGMVLFSDSGSIRGTGLQYLDKPGERSGIPVTTTQEDLLKDLMDNNTPIGPQTFTQGGLRFAREAFDWYEAGNDPEHTPAENKVIALLTDGQPNRMYQVPSDNGQFTSVLPTRFNSVNDIDVVRDTMVWNLSQRNMPMNRYFSISKVHGNQISNKYALYGNRYLGSDRPLDNNSPMRYDSPWQALKNGPTGQIFPYTAWDASIKEAAVAQSKYTVFGLGIGIQTMYDSGTDEEGNPIVRPSWDTVDAAKERFRKLSSPGRFGFAEKGLEIKVYLENLIYQIRDSLKSVEGGRIVDPIGPMYNKIGSTDVKFIDHVDYTDADHQGYTPDGIQKDKERREAYVLNKLSKENSNDRNVILDNLILGKDEEIQIHYQVKINPLAAGFQQNIWYPMNGQTMIYPKYMYDLDVNNRKQNEFFVPSGKYGKQEMKFKKIWTDASGTPLTDQKSTNIPNSVDLKITRESNGTADPAWNQTVTLSKQENWEAHPNLDLADVDRDGNPYTYKVEEKTTNLGEFEFSKTTTDVDEATNTTTYTIFNKKSVEPKLNITKVGAYGDKLTGATFKLTESNGSNGFNDTDNDNAVFSYSGLKLDKIYKLEEMDAPIGYIKLENPILIKYIQKNGKLFAQITAKPFEKAAIKELKDASPVAGKDDTYEIEIKNPEGTLADNQDMLNLTIQNNLQADLPFTGSNGIQRQLVFVLIPMLVLAIGTFFYTFYLKERKL